MKAKIIMTFSTINYVLLKRESEFQPYIAAWNYCWKDGTWGRGITLVTKMMP